MDLNHRPPSSNCPKQQPEQETRGRMLQRGDVSDRYTDSPLTGVLWPENGWFWLLPSWPHFINEPTKSRA